MDLRIFVPAESELRTHRAEATTSVNTIIVCLQRVSNGVLGSREMEEWGFAVS